VLVVIVRGIVAISVCAQSTLMGLSRSHTAITTFHEDVRDPGDTPLTVSQTRERLSCAFTGLNLEVVNL
jgi:hypothetical protein